MRTTSATRRWRRFRNMAGRGLAGEPVRVEECDGQVEVYYGAHRVRSLSTAGLKYDTIL